MTQELKKRLAECNRMTPQARKVDMKRQYCALEILKSLEKGILKDFCSQPAP